MTPNCSRMTECIAGILLLSVDISPTPKDIKVRTIASRDEKCLVMEPPPPTKKSVVNLYGMSPAKVTK